MASIFSGIFLREPKNNVPGLAGEAGRKDEETVGQNSATVAGNQDVAATQRSLDNNNDDDDDATENEPPERMAKSPSGKTIGWVNQSSPLSDTSDADANVKVAENMEAKTPTNSEQRNAANKVTPGTPIVTRKQPPVSNATPWRRGARQSQRQW